MYDMKHKNELFSIDLALGILRAEQLIDEITIMELKKGPIIRNMSELFESIKEIGINIFEGQQKEIEDIFKIISRERILSGSFRVVKVQTPNKIRSLIEKWNPPTAGQMKINDAIADIYTKISNKIQGEFYYYNGKSKGGCSKGRYVYKLIIYKKIAIFVNLYRQISYHILVR